MDGSVVQGWKKSIKMERRKEWGVLLEKAAKNKIKKDGTTETGYKSHPSKKYKNPPKQTWHAGMEDVPFH